MCDRIFGNAGRLGDGPSCGGKLFIAGGGTCGCSLLLSVMSVCVCGLYVRCSGRIDVLNFDALAKVGGLAVAR